MKDNNATGQESIHAATITMSFGIEAKKIAKKPVTKNTGNSGEPAAGIKATLPPNKNNQPPPNHQKQNQQHIKRPDTSPSIHKTQIEFQVPRPIEEHGIGSGVKFRGYPGSPTRPTTARPFTTQNHTMRPMTSNTAMQIEAEFKPQVVYHIDALAASLAYSSMARSQPTSPPVLPSLMQTSILSNTQGSPSLFPFDGVKSGSLDTGDSQAPALGASILTSHTVTLKSRANTAIAPTEKRKSWVPSGKMSGEDVLRFLRMREAYKQDRTLSKTAYVRILFLFKKNYVVCRFEREIREKREYRRQEKYGIRTDGKR
jgi:hypothetical protein